MQRRWSVALCDRGVARGMRAALHRGVSSKQQQLDWDHVLPVLIGWVVLMGLILAAG
jgi:hypothetical protein